MDTWRGIVLWWKIKEGKMALASALNPKAPKKNHFYALLSTRDQEDSSDIVTGMLQVFSIDVYDLLDPSSTLSFVTPLVSINFDVLPDVLS